MFPPNNTLYLLRDVDVYQAKVVIPDDMETR